MLKQLAFFPLAMFCLTTLGATSKCDPRIIKMIEDIYWNRGRCVPKDLLKTGAFLSSETVYLTTKDYYPREEDIDCVFSSIQGSQLKIYIQYENSTSSTEPSSVIQLIEEKGVLIEKDTGIKRYHLYANRLGVTCFYKCSETGKVGDPEGLIKVSARGNEEQAFADAIKDMASLGIIMTDLVYKDNCLPQTV